MSLLNGRPNLFFVPEQLPVAQLLIAPLERQSVPPSFVLQSLEHVFLTQLNPLFRVANLKSSFASTTRNTNRLRLTAELDQEVKNVCVNGLPNQSLTTNQTVIGIQGYTRDYFLVLSYISQATSKKTEIENQRALLQNLVDSFTLIKPTDMEEEERRLRAAGDTRFKKYVELAASASIKFQFEVLEGQWRGLDWDRADSSAHVISDARLLQKAIKAFTVQDVQEAQDKEITELAEMLAEMEQMTPEEIRELFASEDEEHPEATDPAVR